ATGEVLPAGTRKGTAVTCTATPADGGIAGTATVTVANTPPAGGSATVTPAGADATTALSCATSGGTDADGDPIAWSVAWEVDGAPVSAPAPKRGSRVVCVATPSDGESAGSPVRSAALTIASAPPSL